MTATLTPDQVREIMAARHRGETYAEIGRTLGLSGSTVASRFCHYYRSSGYDSIVAACRERVKRPDNSARNAEIMAARFRGATYAEIAKTFGLSKGRVHFLCKREEWIAMHDPEHKRHKEWKAQWARENPDCVVQS